MIQLLYSLLFAEAAVVLLLLVKTPLRKLMIMGLDRAKRGRGPIVVKTIAGSMFVVLVSSVYSIVDIQKRDELGSVAPTDPILMGRHLLEASLMGFSLFLALIIDRLHHYLRELRLVQKSMEAVKKQNRGFEEQKSGELEAVKALEEEIDTLREKIKQLESEGMKWEKGTKAAEDNVMALRKQSEELLHEYDRLLEDNQNLRNQLESIETGILHSGSKKDA